MTQKHYALVGCGASKLDHPAPARELYDSTYFAKKRAFAETFAIDWWILSAEHGLVDPETVLEPYDTTIEDIDVGTWLATIRKQLTATPLLEDPAVTLWVLVGRRYLDAESVARDGGADVWSLRSLLAPAAGTVHFPFGATGGIGEQLAWLSECIVSQTLTLPDSEPSEGDGDAERDPTNRSLSSFGEGGEHDERVRNR